MENYQNAKSVVALVKCESYEIEEVRSGVALGIELLGGIQNIFTVGEKKILLKPNALIGKSPELCVTTHPTVFQAVAEFVIKAGFKVSYGDSPAFGKPATVLEKIGISKIAAELGVPLADFENGEFVSFPEGKRYRQFKIARGVLASDGLISLPKLKTHNFTKMTGSVKNQFGCIPGFSKPEFHVKLPDSRDFSEMLVDLNRFLKSKLFVMDAIESMEGNGPSSGDPVKTNVLLFSTDPVAMDSVACRLIYLKPERVLTNLRGADFGLGKFEEQEIEIIGEDLDRFIQKSFKVDRSPNLKDASSWKYKIAKTLLANKPVIDDSLCRRCGMCVDQCPMNPKAMAWKDNNKIAPPVYNYEKCIRCYCCQEICPHRSISVRKPALRKLVDILYPF